MLADVLEDQLSINATLPRTLIAILFRPGRLTTEYLSGRIASYVPPLRLYLAASLLFFLALSIGSRAQDIQASLRTEGDTTSVPVSGAGIEGALRAVIDSARAAGRQEGLQPDTPGSRPATAESGSRTFLGITIEDQRPGGALPWTERLSVNTGVPRLDAIVETRVRELGALSGEEAARRIGGATLERIPTAMFVLLPVFAALLKLFHIRHGRYYVEHFVFALHYHAFAFLSFTLMLALRGTAFQGLLGLWMGAYLWLALKRVYGQKWFKTTVKWVLLSQAYLFVLVVGLLATAVVAVLTL